MTALTEPTPEHLAELAGCLDAGGLIDAASDAARPYFIDPRDVYRGRAAAILRPASTDQVAAILRLCHRHRIGVNPRAGSR